MQSLDFPGKNIDIAKNQDEYNTLPALVDGDKTISVWVFTPGEILLINKGGRLILSQMNFNQPLQPVRLEISGKFPEKEAKNG